MPGTVSAINLVGANAPVRRRCRSGTRSTSTGSPLAALIRYTGVENDQTFGRWEVIEKAGAYWINIRTDGKVRVGGFFGGCTNPSWKYLDSNVAVPTNTWTHVASTYNGSTLTVWINGARAGSMAVSGTTCSNNRPLAVGAKNYPAGSAGSVLGRSARRHPHLPAGTLRRRDPRPAPHLTRRPARDVSAWTQPGSAGDGPVQ